MVLRAETTMKDIVLVCGRPTMCASLTGFQITRSTGLVGFHTLITALEAGYNVRAIIRKVEQARKIKTHVKIAPHADRLEFAVVPVLAEDGAFDNFLADVVAVLHIASRLAVEVRFLDDSSNI